MIFVRVFSIEFAAGVLLIKSGGVSSIGPPSGRPILAHEYTTVVTMTVTNGIIAERDPVLCLFLFIMLQK
jgi:hypothetical protein